MIRINENYDKLQASYLFSEIARRVRDYQESQPPRPVIRLGIGDVTQPLPAACVAALHRAVDEMAAAATFRGYGPEQGYDFLREAIAVHDFQHVALPLQPMKFSSAMAPSAIPAIFRSSLPAISGWRFPIRSIPSTSIPT